jgi:nuclear cap-binding protein subunit 1
MGPQIVASPSTLRGWVLRSLALDLTHIFEVNRKECARILLSLRDFLSPETFKPLTTTTKDEDKPTSTLSLESLVVNTLLGTMLTLPKSPSPLIHYGSVITELCKLSPNTVAPPVGRAVRRLFGMMGSDGLDVEVVGRVAEWFAVHLSNFGFQWMWKEWYVLKAEHMVWN